MGFLFPTPKTPSYSAPPPAPKVTVPEPTSEAAKAAAQEAADNQRRAAVIAKGRQSTILTGGLGDTSQAPVKMRTLLGEA